MTAPARPALTMRQRLALWGIVAHCILIGAYSALAFAELGALGFYPAYLLVQDRVVSAFGFITVLGVLYFDRSDKRKRGWTP